MYYYNQLSESNKQNAMFEMNCKMANIYQELDSLCYNYNLTGHYIETMLSEFENELLEAIAEAEYTQMELAL